MNVVQFDDYWALVYSGWIVCDITETENANVSLVDKLSKKDVQIWGGNVVAIEVQLTLRHWKAF